MKYDTAGNPIYERIIPNCDCGLTGGCANCNPMLIGLIIFDKETLDKEKDSLFISPRFQIII